MRYCDRPACRAPIDRHSAGDWSSFAIDGRWFAVCSLGCAWTLITGELAVQRQTDVRRAADLRAMTWPLWGAGDAA
jgi:hypothetical protein